MLKRLTIPKDVLVVEIFGQYDNRLRYLKKRFGLDISVRGNEVFIKGENKEDLKTVESIIQEMVNITRDGHLLDRQEFEYLVSEKESEKNSEILTDVVTKTIVRGRVKPKTKGQKKYIEAVENNDIVFVIGPAGTGKTYLASALAVDYLKSGKVNRIILTRPAVEAGEKLGFLPGDLSEKVDPYLRPLFDSLMDMLPFEKFISYREKNIIEIAPLAYMRGRTLNNAFIILDEAQNTTYEQMKMFLTRIGFNSKAIVTGDITQIDIRENSGLVMAEKILKDIEGIGFVYLTEADVVRHSLVKEIIKAYEKYEKGERDEKN
ncbi:DEAD/DEAH box helicase [Thermosipho melanesiensis]|uniref:PhoH-like protein n=2 Tax=Thermosipho melanesiensis TaxID=46541 RepID=A6LKJ5_THEM4|nr:PhoH family protein [Thermosipho melanesiensis]ABR30446.1 PhoH family protein [Thermosipho melanesiensis BI429]APT73606.1 DEAD/DEAH box helicase [Thermosipho melanesiensis]OOC37553.1 DEAD/DEAH box helicase [Thermosipho melanesiensis]OOC39449.1 DEAD/DEAH box helicase [Thermosipho melanesiensis]OOC39512.1 DEAD/DEAH box helicase [Thermosipho melanesiensis]